MGSVVCSAAERSLESEPVVLVQVLLLRVRQPHEKPVLDLLAFGKGLTRRVQALEDLLRVLVRFKTDAHHTKPGQPLEEETDVVTRDQAAGDSPGLRNGTTRAGATP